MKCLKSIKSAILLMKLIRKPLIEPSYISFEYKNSSANYYAHTGRKKKGVMVIFHGGQQLGNLDPRFHPLINALCSCGYDCLLPKLDAYVALRPPLQEDFDSVTDLLDNLFKNKIDIKNNLSFIGVSTSIIYMMKIASNPQFMHEVKSICCLSTYYNPLSCFKELLEGPKDPYGQLITLKLILFSKNKHMPDPQLAKDLIVLDKAIDFFYKMKKENISEELFQFIIKESPESTDLIALIKKLGTSELLNSDLYPYFIKLGEPFEYTDILQDIKSKVTLIHSYGDTVFSYENSYQLADALSKHHIKHHVVVTKLFDHADLVHKNILREFISTIKGFNHFLG